jgi:two-component system, NtrC family, sensor kinase
MHDRVFWLFACHVAPAAIQIDDYATALAAMKLKRFSKRYWMPLTISIMGVLSLAVLSWSLILHANQRKDFALVDAIMDMQIHTATYHLWFEEALYGDPSVSLDNAWADFEHASRLSALMLNGGESERGLILEPLEESWLRTESEILSSLLIQLNAIALRRSQDSSTGGIGSPLDQQFDDVFEEFMTRARGVEEVIKKDQISDQFKAERLFFSTSFVWGVLVIAATAGLCSRELRRLAAEEKLLVANQRLEAQTVELNKHRLYLLELVNDRTAELTSANQELRREIMEHKQTSAVLEESRSRFEKLSLEFNALLDAIPDPILLLSPELEIQWSNRSAKVTARMGLNDLSGRRCYHLRDGRSSPCDDCPVQTAFQTGKTAWRQYSAPDGTVWEIKAFPIWDGCAEVTNVIEVSTDITEKLALQAESMRMGRLACMGELAAGVAHEINNPINGIVNCAQLLIDESRGGSDEFEIPSRIIKEGNRIATIVKSLLAFARQDKAEKTAVRVHEILADALSLSGTQMEKNGITLKVDVPLELPRVRANPQQIEQVFLNVINNARHALNAKYPQRDANKILEIQGEALTIKDHPYVRVAFHDWGTGISEGLMTRIMEPFFSTKDSTCGTGLGLSISHGIVTDHGGKLTIKSIENHYTRVEVILPEDGTDQVRGIS